MFYLFAKHFDLHVVILISIKHKHNKTSEKNVLSMLNTSRCKIETKPIIHLLYIEVFHLIIYNHSLL